METYLIFMLQQEYFAVPVTKVLEVLQKQKITHVPTTPEHILGIINFRGDIIPVIDTRRKFNLPKVDSNEKYVVIVFEIQNPDTTKAIVAATVDTVKDVITIDQQIIKPVPELGLSYDSRFVQGAVRSDEGFILLLDIEKIFSSKDLASVQSLHEKK